MRTNGIRVLVAGAFALASTISFAHDGDAKTTAQHLKEDFGLPAAQNTQEEAAPRRVANSAARPVNADRAEPNVRTESRWMNRADIKVDGATLAVPGRPEFGRMGTP